MPSPNVTTPSAARATKNRAVGGKGITQLPRNQRARQLVLLPQESGNGYYPYAFADRQYGTQNTIAALLDVGRQLSLGKPGFEFGIGDISYANGGPMLPHKTHQKGTDVDIRPIRKGGARQAVSIHDTKNYSREMTRILVEELLAHSNVRYILFNDKKIPGVNTKVAGHHNHLHVVFRS